MSLETMFAQDLAHAFSDLGSTMTYLGHTIDCVAGDMTIGNAFSIDGLTEEADLTLHVLRSDLAVEPKDNDLVTYKTKAFRIAKVEATDDGLEWVLSLTAKVMQ